MSEEGAAEAMEVLSRFLVADTSLEDTLTRVAELTVGAIPAAAFVGIALLDDAERVTTAIFTDEQAPQIDQAQYDERRGPCLDAWREQRIVRIDDVAVEGPAAYPAFSQACLDHGIHSTLSLPLSVDTTTHGAMNLYSRGHAAFGAEQLATASLFAAQAAVVLANASSYWAARARSEQLEEALTNRAEIEQAKGIIMSTMRCTADEAFDVLVKQSQRENRKLREVAREIVQNTVRKT
jgi:GAF domain-containing protein